MFKYFAFISYSSVDYAWGKRLQRKLEHYKMPSTLCSERGLDRYPIKPVFFAPTDIQPGDLSEELKKRLVASRHLIVLCSPASAKSEWVAREIKFFHSLGRSKNIHLFIVEGQPNSSDPDLECFNPVLKELKIPEILGANVHEKVSPWPWVNRDRAYVQLITKLLDIEFDQIWQRHRRQKKARMAAVISGTALVLSIIGFIQYNTLPFDARVDVYEITPAIAALPEMKEAIVTVFLDDETKCDTISSFTDDAFLLNIHRKYMGKQVPVRVSSLDYITKDTVLTLGRTISVGLSRDESYYGKVRFRLYHPEKVMSGCRVRVGQYEAVSDDKGNVSFDIPLEDQRPVYLLSAAVPLVDTVLSMPNNLTTAIEVKL